MKPFGRLVALITLIAATSPAFAQFQTEPDAFDLMHSQIFDSGAVSVLGNDPSIPEGRIIVTITREPFYGQVAMNPDGTFTYEPEPGYVGPDSFEYTVNLVPLQELVFDPTENRLNVDATVDTNTVLGSASDDQEVAINGMVWADIGATGNPIDMIQIVDLDIRNDGDLNLKLDFGSPITLGSLRIGVTVNDLDFGLNLAGPAVPTNGLLNGFTQTGNKLGLSARVSLQGTGLLNGQVPTDPQNLDTETDFDLEGFVINQAGNITVILTINSHNEFDLDGNDVEMDISGQISAVGPFQLGATSDPETVSLNVFSPVNIAEDETPTSLELLTVYPNPVTTNATIVFELDRPTHLLVTVFDILGREVGTLMDSYQRAGEERLTWDASTYPRGIYLLKVTTDTQTKTRAILLQ